MKKITKLLEKVKVLCLFTQQNDLFANNLIFVHND